MLTTLFTLLILVSALIGYATLKVRGVKAAELQRNLADAHAALRKWRREMDRRSRCATENRGLYDATESAIADNLTSLLRAKQEAAYWQAIIDRDTPKSSQDHPAIWVLLILACLIGGVWGLWSGIRTLQHMSTTNFLLLMIVALLIWGPSSNRQP